MVRFWKAVVAGGAVMASVLALPVQPAAAREPAGRIVGAGSSTAIPGQYIVELKQDGSLRSEGVAARAGSLVQRHKGKLGHVYGAALSGFSVRMSEREALELAGDPSVESVYQDQLLKTTGTQDNPPWGLDRIDQRGPDLDTMYTYDVGGTAVTAYILDTGMRVSHSDFEGRARNGWDFVDNDDVAQDCNGHGTMVGGIVGGRRFGVAKNVRLVSVRVMDCFGRGDGADVLAGVNWITANAVRPAVVNVSIGPECELPDGSATPCPVAEFQLIMNAITASINSGITWITSAGNQNMDACGDPFARVPGVITVGATARTDARWLDDARHGSNFGTCVDLFAPGAEIQAPYKDSDTSVSTGTGTSGAAPFVTAAAARILSQPGWSTRTPAEVAGELTINWVTFDRIAGLDRFSPNKLLYVKPPPAAGGNSIAVARNGDGRLDLYGIRPDGSLLLRTQNAPNADAWGAWTAAATTGWYALGANNDRDAHIDLFGLRRKDGDLWHRTKVSTAGAVGTWTAWSQLDGVLNAVGASAQPDGRLEAFATTSQGLAVHRSQLVAGTRSFGPWEVFSLSGQILRGIWAETNGDGRIEVFAVTRTGQIWHRWQTAASATTYTPWVQLDGTLKMVALARGANGRLVLLGVAPNGNVMSRQALAGTNTWSGWTQIARTADVGTLTSITAETYADGRVTLIGVNLDGRIWQTKQTTPGAQTYGGWVQIDGLLRPE